MVSDIKRLGLKLSQLAGRKFYNGHILNYTQRKGVQRLSPVDQVLHVELSTLIFEQNRQICQ